jgi:hypothetical protein
MSGKETPTPALEFPIEQIEATIERAKVGAISAEEYAQLKAVIQSFALLKEELQSKKISIQRLKRMMFGPSTEKPVTCSARNLRIIRPPALWVQLPPVSRKIDPTPG